jgi:hypothetical protein
MFQAGRDAVSKLHPFGLAAQTNMPPGDFDPLGVDPAVVLAEQRSDGGAVIAATVLQPSTTWKA